MTMTEQLAAISEKTAKPKRKPRGKPFQKGQSGNPRHAAGIGFALVLLLLAALWATLAHAASDYPLLSSTSTMPPMPKRFARRFNARPCDLCW